jgi:hypothetical protein
MIVALIALALLSEPAVIIEFWRTGGLAAFEDRVELRDDGSVMIVSRSTKKSLKIERQALKSLAEQLKGSALFDRDRSYVSKGADHVVYTIKYDGHTLRMDDDRIPAQLHSSIERLVHMIETTDHATSHKGARNRKCCDSWIIPKCKDGG